MPTPEELAEQLRRLKASDVVLSLIPTLAQVAWAKLEVQSRDLTEARSRSRRSERSCRCSTASRRPR